jgi:hypothetical protein
MLSAVNNDSLAELLIALSLWQSLRLFRAQQPSQRALLLLGGTLGLGLLTKQTVYYTALPIAFLAIVWRDWQNSTGRSRSSIVHHLALVFIPALSMGALWWIRNLGIYGGFDVLGLARHNSIVVGQPTTSEWIARYGLGGVLQQALTTTFHSFWGQFGWMAVPMPDSTYLLLGLLSLIAFGGWAWWSIEKIRSGGYRSLRPQSVLLALLALLTLGGLIWYNFTFVQYQGRYLFPALIPIGLAFSLGLDRVLDAIRSLANRWTSHTPRDLTPWLDEAQLLIFFLVFIFLARLDLIALQRYIIPFLSA